MAAYWGTPTWRFFHVLAEQMDPNDGPLCQELLYMIRNISAIVPCPDCQQHAKAFWNTVPMAQIKTKADLRGLLHHFHNQVNARHRKGVWPIQMLSHYGTMSLWNSFLDFEANFYTRGNMQLMADEMQRKRLLVQVRQRLTELLPRFAHTDATTI